MFINVLLPFKKICVTATLLLCFFAAQAQLATYPMRTGGGNPIGGQPLPAGTNANITAGSTSVGSEITSQPIGTYNSSGLRVRPNNLAWPTSISNSFCVNIPLAPKANYDFKLTSVTFKNNQLDGNPNLWCQLAYQVNGAGAWNYVGTQQAVTTANLGTTITIGGLNEGFYNGATYIFRFYFYGNGANTKSEGFRMSDLVFNGVMITPPAVKPAVHTTQLTPSSKYFLTAQGTFDQGVGFRITNKAGFLCSVNATPIFANSGATYATTANSPLNETIGGLTPATTYYVRAFAITQADTILAPEILTATTFPYSEPLLNTTAPSNILSNKATSGGNLIDSGGYGVVEKGVFYSTLNSNLVYPATGLTKSTSDGIGNADYSSIIKGLTPNTKYYVIAYARNSMGAGYGGLDSFTTTAPEPVLNANPPTLNFGNVNFNSTSPVLNYILTGAYLTPASGTVTIQAPTGYEISTQSGTGFGATATVIYSANKIAGTRIYVKFITSAYGTFVGNVPHSGGGATPQNTDTVKLTGSIVQDPILLTNSGTDFWLGNAYQERSDRKSADPNEGKLSIYIAAGDQPAIVNVELPGIPGAVGFPKNNITVPANTIVEIKDFPTGSTADNINTAGLPDSRLFYTGVSKRGIHVTSSNGTPVSVWMHTYAPNNSSAGAMIFPSNTWNSSYTVQAYGGQKGATAYHGGFSNNSNPNSFFYAIASEDNTPIWFTPSQDILDSSTGSIFTDGHNAALVKYQKGVTYGPIILNKGEVFNAMGYIEGTGSSANGLDLTGSKVYTNCDRKIAVFGGNGRCIVNTSTCNANQGSDQMVQQMFPKVAWGTKYISVPTKTMEYNLYRITVDDPTTKVWVNNPLHTTQLTGLINNLYYEVNSSQSLLVESDKPINVTQFIVAGDCANSNNCKGVGDPEMIILSPVQQAIDKATVYSAGIKKVSATYNGHYINVVIKKAGIASFRLDGLATADTGRTQVGANAGTCFDASGTISIANAFVKQPFDTSYYWAKFKVAPKTSHTLKSDYPFNAIAYGMGDGESYGYNAGTAIKNLSAINLAENPYGTDTSTSAIKTCVGNPVKIKIALPFNIYTVDSVLWDPGTNPYVSPSGIVKGGLTPKPGFPGQFYATYDGTITVDGRTYNIYSSPQTYTFSQEGTFQIKAIAKGTFASECGSESSNIINILVGSDDISFITDRTPAGDCTSKTIKITDNSTGFSNTSIKTYIWDYGDGSKDTVTSTQTGFPYPTPNSHTYPLNTVYYLKLTTINSIGGVTIDSVKVDLSLLASPTFTISKDSVCPGLPVIFTPVTSVGADKWFWDYGDGSPIDSTTTQMQVSHSYTLEGIQTVSHWIKNSVGCPSIITKDTVKVLHQPIASFAYNLDRCLPVLKKFLAFTDSSTNNTSPYSYFWNFGDLNTLGDTSHLKKPEYTYTVQGTYIVSLLTTNKYGCVSKAVTDTVSPFYNKPTALVANTSDKKVCVGSNANFYDASSGTNQTVNSWYWNFGDGGTATTQNPQHIYTINKTDTVRLAIGTDKGCVSDTATWLIKVNPTPVAGTILPSSCISSGALLFQDNSTVAADDSTQTPYTWTWNFGDGTGTFTTEDSTHTYATIGTYYVTHTITTLNGCTDTKKDTFTIEGTKPVTGIEVVNSNSLCSNIAISVIDTSRVAIGTIKKVQIRWDIVADYTLMDTDLSPSNGAAGSSKTYTHKYPSVPGTKTYWARFYAYSGANCVDSLDKFISVKGSPKAIFDTLRGVCIDGAPRRIDLARDSSNKFNNPLFGTWKYSGPSVVNDTFYPAIAGVGTHYIKVVYTSRIPAIGCRDSAFAPIAVWGLPTPSFTTTTPLCEGTNVTFIDKSTPRTGSGNIGSWLWNFGDAASGTKDTSNQKNPDHNYSAYNTYNVTLKVTSDSGCSATLTPPQAVVVHPKPKVGFIVPPGVCSGTAVGFTDTSKIADNSENQFTHFWNFGDNTNATGTPLANTSHLYAAPPTDSVRLIVTSKDGCKDSLVVKLSSVVFPQQAPVFSANGKTIGANDTIKVCVGNSILFRNTNTPAANQGFWEFGDTASLVNTGKTVAHTYPNATVYTGKHYADDNNGCRTTTANFNVLIWSLPTPIISVANPTCEKNAITFTDNSTGSAGTGNIKSRVWNFGDPSSGSLNSDTMRTSFHSYNVTGFYNVYLTVTSDSGCVATSPTATVVNVHPNPKVKFGVPAAVCLPLAAQFSDSSTIADGSEAQFTHTWDFGEPASGTANTATGSPLTTTSHFYGISNNYSIKLTVQSKDGCIDSKTNVLSSSAIHNQPTSNYAVNTPSHDTPRVCLGTPISFKDSSGGNVATSYWVWGDEGLTTYLGKIPPPHLFTPSGTFYGIHFIDDNNGCRSDTSDFITFIDSFPVVRGGEKYVLAGTSSILTPYISGGDSYLWTPVITSNPTNDYLDFNDVENPLCTPLDSVVYRIDVAAGVCAAAPVYYTVKIFTEPVIPNAFSPNGDGVNDTWDIASLKFFTGATVQVFNRYGQVVFTSLGYSKNWNGTDISGSPLPMGVYYYIIKPGLGLPMTNGSLTILR